MVSGERLRMRVKATSALRISARYEKLPARHKGLPDRVAL